MATRSWRNDLTQIFAASVNQQTLEQAAAEMAAGSACDHSYHDECMNALDSGIQAAFEGDSSVIAMINRSGFQVGSTQEAASLLSEFRGIYLEAFRRESE